MINKTKMEIKIKIKMVKINKMKINKTRMNRDSNKISKNNNKNKLHLLNP